MLYKNNKKELKIFQFLNENKNSINCLKNKKNFSLRRLKENIENNINSTNLFYMSTIWNSNKKFKYSCDVNFEHSISHSIVISTNNKTFNKCNSFELYLKKGSLFQNNTLRQDLERIVGFEILETARLKFYFNKDSRNILFNESIFLQENNNYIYRKRLITKLYKLNKLRKKSSINKRLLIAKTITQDFINTKIINLKNSEKISKFRFNKFKNKKLLSDNVKLAHKKSNFPIMGFLKKTIGMVGFPSIKTFRSYKSYELYRQYIRHPNTQLKSLNKYIRNVISIEDYRNGKTKNENIDMTAQFFKIYWRYFKFKIERFFYNHLHVRVHIWFLNIWDVFLSGVDALWRWFRYEDKTTYFLTKKGQRFLIEDRENAKFYVRTMTLTLTMVGGVKLFMDNISLMMKKHRNNWAFILHTTKSLRFCINYFWFRFFVNYKVTLQGKIGGFLRAQKKTFKKGNISIENKSSAINYYRGYPITRFGSYNLSFWLQYRIPNLVEKFGDLEYVDTMKVLLNMYSVPWLVSRLSTIIQHMLMERVFRTNRKLAQYSRRIKARKIMIYQAIGAKKYHFKNTSLKVGNVMKFNKLKDIVLKKKYTKIFNKKTKKKLINRYYKKINKN